MVSKVSVVAVALVALVGAPRGLCAESTASGAASQSLQGGVQKVQVSLEHLRDIGLDLKQVMSSARHLYDEVNIQPVTMITQPSMVGPGTIINIPIGTMPVGPVQQPRKARVDAAMATMTPIIRTLRRDADNFIESEKQLDVSPAANAEIEPLLKDWFANVNKISAQLTQLEQLTTGPTYNNASISAVCSQMQNTAHDMDKVRSKVFKIIKKEHKR